MTDATETLFTAARRVVRDFNIDMSRGGIMTVDTQRSVETLAKMVHAEEERVKRERLTKNDA